MTSEFLLEARNLEQVGGGSSAIRNGLAGWPVLQNVSFSVARGESFAIIGDAGSGKSVLARCLAGIEAPLAGEVRILGDDLHGVVSLRRERARKSVHLLVPESTSVLNPRFTAEEVIEEALLTRGILDASAREERIFELVQLLGLGERGIWSLGELHSLDRLRVALARSLAGNSEVLILDETLNSLPTAHHVEAFSLLNGLRERLKLNYVVLTRHAPVARRLAARVAYLQDGRLLEFGDEAMLAGSPATDSRPSRATHIPTYAYGSRTATC